ncbi:unnamed protein product [Rhodiola kirilowii]
MRASRPTGNFPCTSRLSKKKSQLAPQTRQSSRSIGPASRPTDMKLGHLKTRVGRLDLQSVELTNAPDGPPSVSIESVDWTFSRPTGKSLHQLLAQRQSTD